MSFQAYLDNIKKKTGKTPDEFRVLAKQKGLLRPDVKASQVVAWLKAEFGLGHGHAMAIYAAITSADEPRATADQRVHQHFSGRRSEWRIVYDRLLEEIRAFGPGVTVKPTDSYISVLRNGKKFAIFAPKTDRFDVGLKLRGVKAGRRLAEAGTWNTMVTHRVSLETIKQADSELIDWLRLAYESV